MRQIRASFLLLLFITSFVRCWADSRGLLGDSSLACCEPTPTLHHDCDHDHHGEEEEEPDDHEPIKPDEHECPTCQLVNSGFLPGSANPELPNPLFIDLDRAWTDLLERLTVLFPAKTPPLSLPPDPPERSAFSVASRLVTRSAISVRGPDLV